MGINQEATATQESVSEQDVSKNFEEIREALSARVSEFYKSLENEDYRANMAVETFKKIGEASQQLNAIHLNHPKAIGISEAIKKDTELKDSTNTLSFDFFSGKASEDQKARLKGELEKNKPGPESLSYLTLSEVCNKYANELIKFQLENRGELVSDESLNLRDTTVELVKYGLMNVYVSDRLTTQAENTPEAHEETVKDIWNGKTVKMPLGM